ncbi:MAG: chromosome segregation protein SMC, partial [Desulfosalsimonadaceae bacterium]
MQLKRLEITGFKSFADKCAIDFPPGISSIVGPNGCGKSNIIDAIKWAMGEQSVKQLRGKSMGDVIFAGTDRRAPLNMAEVSLIIAGHDGTGTESLDQYTEIMVTRRLYRSGESHYLINRQPCRLKDVSDIFLRYSMGSRSCAIIQQGNIGAITDASPEERRAFIEEAAGVVRYKTRRQEALSKVSATRENLLRLNDILDEIKSRLDELSVEAEKARRFRNCRSNLKTHDILVTVYYHEQYTRKIESTEKLLHQLNEKTAYKSEEIEGLHAALQEIASYRREKSDAISEKKNAKDEKQRTAEKLDYEHKHLKSEEARITEDNERFERSLEELEKKNKQIEEELEKEQHKLIDLQNRTDSAEKEIEKQNQAVAEHKKKLSEQSGLLDEKKDRLMTLSAQHARHQNIFQNAAANKENLERRISRINEEIANTEQEISELSDSADTTRSHRDETKMHLDSLLRRKSECETTLKEKNAALSEKIRTVAQRENERSRYKSRLAVLKKMESNFEWYKDGVRAIMKNRGEIDEDGRIRGIAAEVVDPAEGFEHAVEAAMGESLQYIIVNGRKAGIDYIDFLKKEKAGRSGFIPIDISTSTDNPDPGTASGRVRAQMLADHVHIRPGFESIIKTMLAGVAVVEDINEAISLWQTGNGLRKIVTRQGDVVSGKGILVGGSRDQLAGILEKRQEIKQLQQDINAIDDTIAVEKKRQKEMEASVKTLENTLSDITQKKFKYEADHLDAEKLLYKTTEKLKHARRQMEIISLEKEKLSGEKADMDSEIEHHDQVLQDISHDIESEKSEIEEITGVIESLKDTVRTFNNRLVDLKLDATRLSAESENTRRTVSRLKTFQSEGIDRSEEIRSNIESGKKRKQTISGKITACQSALAETLASLKQIKQDLAAEENDYQRIIDD